MVCAEHAAGTYSSLAENVVLALVREGEWNRKDYGDRSNDQGTGPPDGDHLRCIKRCRERAWTIMVLVPACFSVMFVSK